MNERTESEIKDEIAQLISELVNVRNDDDPFVTGWALCAIVQSTRMLNDNAERTEYIHPTDQSVAVTVGLHTIAARHVLEDNVDDL